MFKAFSPTKARQINEEVFARAQKLGVMDRGPGRIELFLPNVEQAAGLAPRAREEAFLSRYAEKIPGIRLSQRTFNTFGNKLKVDVAEKAIRNWAREGTEATPEMLDSLNRFLNVFTGRGSFPKGQIGEFRFDLEPMGDVLNIAFWSPRLFLSRLQAPTLLLDPVVRKMAAQNLAASFGLGMSILGIVKASGLGTVELDPRSSDFGQIRLGRARINFWAGFQQIARYMAQIAVNQSKNRKTGKITTGEEFPFYDRQRRVTQFVRSKLAPGVPVVVADWWFGKTFLGEELGKRPDKGRLPDLLDEAFNRLGVNSAQEVSAIQQLLPLAQLDMIDAIDELGFAAGLGFSIMPFVGIGTQIFNVPREEEELRKMVEESRRRGTLR
jgi:hypothetical protein